MENICADFDSSAWQTLYGALTAACNMPDGMRRQLSNETVIHTAPTREESFRRKITGIDNPFSGTALVAGMCKTGNPINPASYPEGKLQLNDANYPQKMFSFLGDLNQYVTFSANSGFSMDWTSTVQDSTSLTTTFTSGYPQTYDGSIDIGFDVTMIKFDLITTYSANWGASIEIGKTSTSSHEFDRTVAITLSDPDEGKHPIRKKSPKYYQNIKNLFVIFSSSLGFLWVVAC